MLGKIFGFVTPPWIKWAAIGLGALFIVSVVGGYFLYQKSTMDGFQKTIKAQQEQIAGLELDKVKLEISNESLKNENERKIAEAKDIREMLERLSKSDRASAERLAGIEKKLNNPDKIAQAERIRQSKKASLLLRLMDKQTVCFTEHFEDYTGTCQYGNFVPFGTVPPAPPAIEEN